MKQKVTITEHAAGGGSTVLVDKMLTTPSNIGKKSTPNYTNLENAAIRTVGSGANQVKIYAGQTDDAFWVDLQVFDLLTLRGQDAPIGYTGGNNRPQDSVSGFNVHTLVLEIPISRLKQGNEPVLGVWASTTRDGDQVSRLGMPLVNEVVIPLALKDAFNTLTPEPGPRRLHRRSRRGRRRAAPEERRGSRDRPAAVLACTACRCLLMRTTTARPRSTSRPRGPAAATSSTSS